MVVLWPNLVLGYIVLTMLHLDSMMVDGKDNMGSLSGFCRRTQRIFYHSL